MTEMMSRTATLQLTLNKWNGKPRLERVNDQNPPDDDDVELNVLGCRLTYLGQTGTSACAGFNVALRLQKP